MLHLRCIWKAKIIIFLFSFYDVCFIFYVIWVFCIFRRSLFSFNHFWSYNMGRMLGPKINLKTFVWFATCVTLDYSILNIFSCFEDLIVEKTIWSEPTSLKIFIKRINKNEIQTVTHTIIWRIILCNEQKVWTAFYPNVFFKKPNILEWFEMYEWYKFISWKHIKDICLFNTYF